MIRRRWWAGGVAAMAWLGAAGEARAQDGDARPVTDDAAPERGRVPWIAPNGSAVAFSYENGLWGSAFEQGLRVKIPFHPNWGLVTGPLALHAMTADPYRADLGGRLELYGASPVVLDFARIYGGGGMYALQAVTGLPGAKASVGGGGHFGFEFFYSGWSSFYIEVGGTSGGQHGLGGGGTAVAGVTWYPFASSPAEARVASR